MTTGACGIDCTVCLLHVRGVCSTCGSGTSMAGRQKLEAQKRLFNKGCAVLQCAVDRKVAYCMRDCQEFPCDAFSQPSYPYGQGFLQMQARRRATLGQGEAHWPENASLFWEMLEERSVEEVCLCSGATHDQEAFHVSCLHETWRVDPGARSVTRQGGSFGGEWDRQLPFLLLAYLTKASGSDLGGQMVSPRELTRGQDLFQGKNAIDVTDLEKTFGEDPERFLEASRRLGGRETGKADVSALFEVFPKLPVEFLLWRVDEEFPAKVTVLLDGRTALNYPVEGIANCVNLLVRRLLLSARESRRGD